MKKFVLLLLFFILPTDLSAQPEALVHQGNDLYQKSEYTQAIETYQKVLSYGFESAELYYNLANAFFKNDDIGQSILYYEKAKRLAPHDPDILFNLQIAQLRTVDKVIQVPTFFLSNLWNGFKSYFNSQQLAWYALNLYLLGVTLMILKILWSAHKVKRVLRLILLPLVTLFFICSTLLFFRLRDDIRIREAIILVDKVDVKSSPSSDATEVFALHEGAKVRVHERSGTYYKIGLPDGKIGWIPETVFETI